MKSALITGFRAFIQTLKENRVEQAQKLLQNNGYSVQKSEPKKEENE